MERGGEKNHLKRKIKDSLFQDASSSFFSSTFVEVQIPHKKGKFRPERERDNNRRQIFYNTILPLQRILLWYNPIYGESGDIECIVNILGLSISSVTLGGANK
jgi:hypothetical protein